MRVLNSLRSRSGGFTLVEILVALALVTGLTLMMFQAVSPWMSLRQKIETERRLDQVRSALETAYSVNAMQIEGQSGAVLRLTHAGTTRDVVASTLTGASGSRRCDPNQVAAEALAPYVADDVNRSLTDGSKAPLCLFITSRTSQDREGVPIYYHVAAIVALGNDGVLGATTALGSDGVLTIHPGSDDLGVVVNGFTVQYDLYKETRRRVERVADLYGSYFTARYLGNPARDYSIDYFVASNAQTYYDGAAAGTGPQPTGSMWMPVSQALANLGLGPDEKVSAYESSNAIEVANQALDSAHIIAGVQVQEPATKAGLALPPYTALLRARLPGPSNTYLLRVVPGNY